MRRVAIGSSAEHGSSISSTVGSVATARAMHRRCCWPPDSESPLAFVLHLVPQRRPAQRMLHALADTALEAVEAQPKRDIVKDAHRERIGLLEHHADVAPHDDGVDVLAVDVLAEEIDVAFQLEPLDQVVHAVETAQNGALAAAGRTDEAGDLALLDRHVAVADGKEVSIQDLLHLTVDGEFGAIGRRNGARALGDGGL
jgi:hypothetical protein